LAYVSESWSWPFIAKVVDRLNVKMVNPTNITVIAPSGTLHQRQVQRVSRNYGEYRLALCAGEIADVQDLGIVACVVGKQCVV
jgi:hypothetical protein